MRSTPEKTFSVSQARIFLLDHGSQVGPTGIEPVPTASETIVLSIGLRAHVMSCCGRQGSVTNLGLASIGFADFTPVLATICRESAARKTPVPAR